MAALDGEDNKKTSEKLQGIDLPVDPLSLYNFVCQVQGLVEKTSDWLSSITSNHFDALYIPLMILSFYKLVGKLHWNF